MKNVFGIRRPAFAKATGLARTVADAWSLRNRNCSRVAACHAVSLRRVHAAHKAAATISCWPFALLSRRRLAVDLTNRSAGHLVARQNEIDFVDFTVSAFHVDYGRGFVAAEFPLFVEFYRTQREIFSIQCNVKLLVFLRRQLLVEITFHALRVGGLCCGRGSSFLLTTS